MKILNLTKVDRPGWKTKATFTVETKNFRIHQCRLVLGETGRLVADMPYREFMSRGQKKYDNIIEILDVDYLEAVTSAACVEAVRLWKENWWS